MSRWKFGMIVGMDYAPELRLLAVAQYHEPVWARETWGTVVLTDDPLNPDHWEVGRIITVSPHTTGIVIYEE